MKILHMIPKQKLGGVETAAFSAFKNFDRNKYEFNIIIIERNSIKSPDVEGDFIRLNTKFYNPLGYYNFLKIMAKEKPDIIVFSLWKSILFCFFAKFFVLITGKKTQLVIIRHSARYSHALDKYVSKLGYKVSNKILFDSNTTKDFFHISEKREISGSVISFIPAIFSPKSFDFNSNCYRFVYIGRIHSVKNIMVSIKFVEMLKKKGVNILFHIYGPDEGELEVIEKYAYKHNMKPYVEYKGPLDRANVEKTLAEYDFFLQTSSQEGMAMSVVESLQVGVIPCVTKVGEIANYAYDNVNAFLFDASRIHNDNYLSERAACFINSMSETKIKEMYNEAISTFQNVKTYAEDFFEKIQ